MQLIKNNLKYIVVLAWIVAVGAVMYKQYKYSFTAGEASEFKDQFPKSSVLSFNEGKFNLVTFIHPKCACSKATLENLKVLNKLYGNKLQFHVVFYMPTAQKEDWKSSKYISEVESMEHTKIYFDEDEKEFTRFDAKTSGQSFLFSSAREMLFKGGLTQSRGHEGDSVAMRGIASTLDSENPKITTAPTFGCENDIKKH